MLKTYKAVVFAPSIVSEKGGIRYAIVDIETGEIMDDAQGYGYKSAQKAYAGWAYKNRDKSRDAEKAEKEIIINTGREDRSLARGSSIDYVFWKEEENVIWDAGLGPWAGLRSYRNRQMI